MPNDDILTEKVTVLPNGRLTARNAALYLGVAEKTLAMKRCDGTGPKFTKIGGRIFYAKASLDDWLDRAGEFLSTTQAQFHQQQQQGEG